MITDDEPLDFTQGLKMVQRDYVSEDTSDPVMDALADMVTDCLKLPVDPKLMVERKKVWLRPANIPTLLVPTINPEIWNHPKTRHWAQTADSRYQANQELLVKGMIPIIRVADTLMTRGASITPAEIKYCATTLVKGVQLLCCCSADMNNRRKDQFKRTMPSSLKSLCSHTSEVTTWLFGDDVASDIDKINKTHNIYGAAGSDFRHQKGHNKNGRSFSDNGRNGKSNKSKSGKTKSNWKPRRAPYNPKPKQK